MTQKIKLALLALTTLVVSSSVYYGCGSIKNTPDGYTGIYTKQPFLGYRTAKMIDENGLKFKDLNRNNAIDPYED